MATLKAIVKTKMRNGMYKVYIRFTHNRQFSYMRTSWMVNEKGLSDDKKDIIDPFVIQQTSILIEECYNKLNQVDTSKWSAKEVLEFVLEYEKDISFSDYARLHIDKMIKRGQERTSRNYKWALQHLEKFARTDNLMFSRLTSAFLNRWIETLSQTTTRSKEQYPVCIREIYKAAIMEFNDEERGLSKLNNPWSKVKIPRSDVPEKRAIPASKLRAFFNVVPDRSRFTNPLMEVGQDVALISFCMFSKKADSPWLFNFHDRLSTSDSFCANVNTGIKQVWEKVEPGFRASLYAFRHSWATIAQNECGATMNEVDFGLNHSINRMARVYVKIDYTPVWILNEKVIDFVFFTDNESKHIEKEDKSFERISKYNNVRAEAYVMGKMVCAIEDTGFSNVDQIMDKLTTMLPKKISNTRVQFKITNIDKELTQMYQRLV